MRRLFCLVLGLALCCAAAAKPPVPLLWKAERGAGTVYLLGSFHLLKSDDYPLDPALDAVFADAEKLVFELPPEALGSPDAPALAQRYARFADGMTLRGVISAQTAERLTKFLGSEAALAAADPFEPWFMGMNLTVMTLMQAGFDPTKGLDLHLMQRSREANKPASGLETLEQQFQALDSIPLSEQDRMLADALESPPELRRRLAELHDYWRAGDAAGLERLLVEEMLEETPVAYSKLLVERNQQWLPRIEALLAEQDDHLVVVGSLHLLGKDGLIEQLQRRGAPVVRVTTE